MRMRYHLDPSDPVLLRRKQLLLIPLRTDLTL